MREDPAYPMFQSLSGFQVRCNSRLPRGRPSSMPVSIPVGFSSPLQPKNVTKVAKNVVNVSIPVGFSSPLQREQAGKCVFCGVEFQSLSGFQVRCNTCEELGVREMTWSFNPCRVFKSAATCWLSGRISIGLLVSIPVGFSSPLQLECHF